MMKAVVSITTPASQACKCAQHHSFVVLEPSSPGLYSAGNEMTLQHGVAERRKPMSCIRPAVQSRAFPCPEPGRRMQPNEIGTSNGPCRSGLLLDESSPGFYSCSGILSIHSQNFPNLREREQKGKHDDDAGPRRPTYPSLHPARRDRRIRTPSGNTPTHISQKASRRPPLRFHHHCPYHWLQPVLRRFPRVLPLSSPGRSHPLTSSTIVAATNGPARLCRHAMLRTYLGRRDPSEPRHCAHRAWHLGADNANEPAMASESVEVVDATDDYGVGRVGGLDGVPARVVQPVDLAAAVDAGVFGRFGHVVVIFSATSAGAGVFYESSRDGYGFCEFSLSVANPDFLRERAQQLLRATS